MHLEYFKDKDLSLLFQALKDKYIKTSKLVGTIKITPSNEEEANKISRFIGSSIKVNTVSVIKIKDIEYVLNNSKFEGIDILDILEYLYGDITTKRELKEKILENKNKLLDNLLTYYKDYPIYNWLSDNINKKDEFYKRTIHILKNDEGLMYNIINSLMYLPIINNKYENLSVFASNITKDPHYFDLNSSNGNSFIWYVSMFLNIEYDKSRSRSIDILNKAGIYVDSFSNFVITYNFLGSDYLNIMQERQEVVLLSLDNIIKIENIKTRNKKVIILENPSLLASIVDIKTDTGFIITSGNPNIAMYKLLDKLSGHKLYYNGDFDPEGLLIADKLKIKYKDRLTLIGYDKDNFYKALSLKNISDTRIKKLDKIETKELNAIKNEIIQTKKGAYQEKLIDFIVNYIKNT